MRLAAGLIGAEQQSILLLAQIVGGIGIAQQRQLPVTRFELGDLLGYQILMRQADAGHVAAEHGADLMRPVARRIDHIVAAHLALLGLDDPFAALAMHARDRAEAHDLGAEPARAMRQSLGQLGGIDVAIGRVPQPAFEVMRFEEGIDVAHLLIGHHFETNAHMARHGGDMGELLHPLARMGQSDRPGDMVVHRIADIVAERRVEPRRIVLQRHHRPGADEVRAIARRMPGRARGQLVLFEKQTVGPAGLGQMIEHGAPDRAAANDDDPRRRRQIGHAVLPDIAILSDPRSDHDLPPPGRAKMKKAGKISFMPGPAGPGRSGGHGVQ